MFVSEGVGLDLLEHSEQAIAARGRQMVVQTDGVNKVEVGIENLLRGAVAEHAHQHRDDTLDNNGVAIGLEVHLAVDIVGLEPHTALAAVNKVVGGLVLLVEGWHGIAHINDERVAIEPVGKALKLFDDFVLNIVNSIHWLVLGYQRLLLLQNKPQGALSVIITHKNTHFFAFQQNLRAHYESISAY